MITPWNDDLPLSSVMNLDFDEINREYFDNNYTLDVTDEQKSSNVCQAEINFYHYVIECLERNKIRYCSKCKNKYESNHKRHYDRIMKKQKTDHNNKIHHDRMKK